MAGDTPPRVAEGSGLPPYETSRSAPRQAKSLAGSRPLPRPPPRSLRFRRFRRRRRGLRRPAPACLRKGKADESHIRSATRSWAPALLAVGLAAGPLSPCGPNAPCLA